MEHLKSQVLQANISCLYIQQPPRITGISAVTNAEKLNTEIKTQFKHLLKNKVFHKHEEIFKGKIIINCDAN